MKVKKDGKTRNDVLRNLILSHRVGVPLTSKKLRELDVSSRLAHKYTLSGWLENIGKGFFKFKDEEITTLGLISALSENVKLQLHIGGRYALFLRGIFQYLRTNENIYIYGSNKKYALPDWLESYRLIYTTKNPFKPDISANYCVSPIDGGLSNVLVSERERAFFELLDGVGTFFSINEVNEIASSLTSLRYDYFINLLSNCRREKVKKLALEIGKEYNMPWYKTYTSKTQ